MDIFFEKFCTTISEWSKSGILDFWGILLSSIVPVIIMMITLRFEKKIAKEDAFERNQQYQESMRTAKVQHLEELKTQNEINRISIMPYLTIKNISAQIDGGRIVFNITFKNIGNGTAINLTTKYLEMANILCPVHQTALATYCCIQPFDVYLAVARPDEECELSIAQDPASNLLGNSDCFCVTVKYSDMKSQQYTQAFAVYFDVADSGNIDIVRKIINNPELQ